MKRFIPIFLILLLFSNAVMAEGRLRHAGDFITHFFEQLANFSAEKAVSAWYADDLQISSGSAPLNNGVNYENWNGTQFTALVTVKGLYFVPGDGITHYILDNQGTGASQNRIELYVDTAGLLIFDLHDTDSTQHRVEYDITGWGAKSEHQIVARYDLNTDEMVLYTDSTLRDDTPDAVLSGDTITAVESDTHIGSDNAGVNQLNGSIAILLEDRSWLDSEVVLAWDSAAGNVAKTFTVSPDSLAIGNYSDGVTSITYHHSGKAVSAISAGGTEATLTSAASTDTSLADSDAVVVSDATGYSKAGFVDGTPSDTQVLVDDGAGAAVGDIEKVGVAATLNGNSHYFSVTDAAFPDTGITGANDLTIYAWVNPENVSGNKSIVSKRITVGNKRMYKFALVGDEVQLGISSDGTSANESFSSSTFVNIKANVWTFIVCVYDASAGSVDFYKNGIFIQQVVGAETSIADKDPDFQIGTNEGGNLFNGRISYVTLFDDMRTAAEILVGATNSHGDLSGEGNIVCEYGFDDAASETVIDNIEGTAAGDLALNGGDTTNYGTHARTQSAHISRNLLITVENGGIGGITVGDAATTLSKSTTEIFKDTQSLKVLNGDGTQAFARQTITTTATDDYRFFGRFFAPDTPNGASRLVDIDLAAGLSITVTQADLAAGWNDISFSFQAADASTTVDFGSGSVTNTEFSYWDDVRIMEELVVMPGCEGADGNALPTGWSDTGSPDPDETQTDTADKHSGASSILLNAADTDEGATQSITVVSGEYYTLEFWEKNNAQDVDVVLGNAVTETIDATGDNTWTNHGFTFLTTTTTLTVSMISGAAAQSGWFDDITIVRLDTRAASTATKTPGFWPKHNPLSPSTTP